jgi:hypothetical protein
MRLTGLLPLLLALPAAVGAAECGDGPAAAALENAASLETLEWTPFRRAERGWAPYAVKVAVEIDTRCGAATPGFAAALARWQAAHRLPATGVFDAAGFAVMNTRWTLARPFVVATRGGGCPLPPPAEALAVATPAESYGGKTIMLRADTLAAYRRLRAAARAELPPGDPDTLRIFSGYRAPEADDLRCQVEGNCDGGVRAVCSSHRTGTAIDVHVGHAEGFGPDSSDDGNRRAMVRTLAYRWLVTNAARFGFFNYVFEPWHWEWAGTAAAGPAPTLDRPRR